MNRFAKLIVSFAIFVAACYVGLMWFVNNEVGKGINRAVAETPGMSLSYSDLSVSLRDHSVTLTGVETKLPDGQYFAAEAVRITRFDQINPVPHFVTAEASGVVVETSRANFGSWAAILAGSGRSEVTGDLALEYDFDPQNQALTIKTLSVKSTDLCDLHLSGTVTQLDLDALRMEKLLGLRIKDAELIFTDHSFMDALLQGGEAQVSAELATMADYAGKDGNTVAEDALRGIKRFVDHPGTITISANPAEPVPYLYFFMGRDIYDNIRLMNISVETDSSDDI